MIQKALIVVFTVLTLVTLVLWVGSYHSPFWFSESAIRLNGSGWDKTLDTRQGYFAHVAAERGHLVAEYRSRTPPHVPSTGTVLAACGLEISQLPAPLYCDYPSAEELSAGLQRFQQGIGPVRITTFRVGLWLPLMLVAGYPAAALIRGPVRRYRRRLRSECLHCGYNLTGNVSGRCPECGTATAVAP